MGRILGVDNKIRVFNGCTRRSCFATVIVVHSVLVSWSAATDSPAIDEMGHLAAGLSHWTTGHFDLYRVNPPLVRLVASLPVLFENHGVNLVPSGGNTGVQRLEYVVAGDLARRAGPRIFWWMTIARWTCLPFTWIGAYVCYCWGNQLFGSACAWMALILWCFSPSILGYGHLITPDLGAASLGAAAGWTFWRWLRSPSWKTALIAGLVLGFAELAKSTWIVLFGLWPVLWLVLRLTDQRNRSGPTWRSSRFIGEDKDSGHQVTEAPEFRGSLASAAVARFRSSWLLEGAQLAVIVVIGLDVLNLGYGFEGSFENLGEQQFTSELLGGPAHSPATREFELRNRFFGTWMGYLPVPLPSNYLSGIDLQRSDFENRMLSYLRGEWRLGGWWYYYLYALLIKEPIGTWLLLVLSIGLALFGRGKKTSPSPPFDRSTSSRLATGKPSPVPSAGSGQALSTGSGQAKEEGEACAEPTRYRASWRDELFLLAPAILVMALVSSQTGFNHHVRYVLPSLPFLFISMSKIARCMEFRQWKIAVIAGALLIWSIGSSVYYFPHSLSYFNELTGGPRGGHFHIGNSNVDWGQDLLNLKQWYDANPEARPLHLAYDNWVIDPKVAANIDAVPVAGGPVMNRPGAPATRDWPWNNGTRGGHVDAPPPGADKSMSPKPGWYVVSVNQIHRREGDLEYLLEFDPVTTIGYSMYVYHITLDEANRIRRKLGMSELGRDIERAARETTK